MFYYKINKNNALIQYKEDAIPKNIKSIDYLEFEIANHDYTLNKYHIDNLLEDFIKEDNYKVDYKQLITSIILLILTKS